MESLTSKTPRNAILIAFLSIYLIWGSTYLAIKYAIDTVPPFMMAGTRFLIAGVAFYAVLRLLGTPKPTGKQWVQAGIVGTFLVTLGNGGVVLAEKYVPTGICALLVAMVPVYIAVLEHINKGMPSLRTTLGLLLGTVGIFSLVGPAAFVGQSTINWMGIVAVVVGSMGWSIGSVYSRSADLPKSPFLSTAMQMICGGASLSLVSLVLGEYSRLDVSKISFLSAASFAYLIVFGSIIGYSAYVFLLKHQSPSKVSTYAYVNPVVAVLLGWALLKEDITPQTGYSALIILAAVFLITAQPKRKLAVAEVDSGATDPALLEREKIRV